MYNPENFGIPPKSQNPNSAPSEQITRQYVDFTALAIEATSAPINSYQGFELSIDNGGVSFLRNGVQCVILPNEEAGDCSVVVIEPTDRAYHKKVNRFLLRRDGSGTQEWDIITQAEILKLENLSDLKRLPLTRTSNDSSDIDNNWLEVLKDANTEILAAKRLSKSRRKFSRGR